MWGERKLWLWWVSRVVQLGIAGVLFWSGAEHVKNPFVFLSSVLKYKLIGGFWATSVAGFLPIFQLILAAMILLGVHRRLTCGCAAGLLTLFSAAQFSALARGLAIGCGCFGASQNAPITVFSVLQIGSLGAAAWGTFAYEIWNRERTEKTGPRRPNECADSSPMVEVAR